MRVFSWLHTEGCWCKGNVGWRRWGCRNFGVWYWGSGECRLRTAAADNTLMPSTLHRNVRGQAWGEWGVFVGEKLEKSDHSRYWTQITLSGCNMRWSRLSTFVLMWFSSILFDTDYVVISLWKCATLCHECSSPVEYLIWKSSSFLKVAFYFHATASCLSCGLCAFGLLVLLVCIVLNFSKVYSLLRKYQFYG